MMKKNNFLIKREILIIFCCFLFCFKVFASTENEKWTIAAQKFKYAKGQTSNALTEATAETLPSRILEKIGNSLVRSVKPDERLERMRYDSRNNRISLFLQLSNEYKRRDSLVLNNYSDYELKKKIAEEEEKIQEIKQKINENLEELKKAEDVTEKMANREEYERERQQNISKSELWKYSTLLKHLFVKDEDYFKIEDITFYRDDYTSLFSPSEKALQDGYTSYAFEKECVSSNINTLLTGTITTYGDYLSVAVELYLYPGGKLIGSIVEVGSMQELDFLCTNIAQHLIPIMVNSMPVQVQIVVGPEDINSEVFLYFDEQLQTSFSSKMLFDSGVHTIQFTADGYRSVGTSYFFEGNKKYLIEVKLEEQKNGIMQIGINQPGFDLFLQKLPFQIEYSQAGKVYTNGIESTLSEENISQISINGNKILGQFISEDGQTSFFYIPEKLIHDGSSVTINPKPIDRSEYIETRRKWMYGSYSMLITSLVPYFYCYGNFTNMYRKLELDISLYNDGLLEYNDYLEDFNKTKKWQKRTLVSMCVSVTCGVVLGIELFRYFKAANSVLPEKAKFADYVEPIPGSFKLITEETMSDEKNIESQNQLVQNEQTEDVEKTENIEQTENIEKTEEKIEGN